ncbi:23S rRNA (uracil(1939)-C(5))-methyltransferase RlmD [Robinsoniella peoriensis]|uniref:23S rRNA (uracil(1939)-C(5))-methyltransferase RlmD n=1 Tax=Robinsoniella peoriensis TaxID=180332 RepID=UPI003751C2DB
MKTGTQKREMKKTGGRKDYQNKEGKSFEKGKSGKKKADMAKRDDAFKGDKNNRKSRPGREEDRQSRVSGVSREDWHSKKPKAGRDDNRESRKLGAEPGNRGSRKPETESLNRENRKPGAVTGNRENRKPGTERGNRGSRNSGTESGNRGSRNSGAELGNRENRKPGAESGNRENRKPGTETGNRESRKPGAVSGNRESRKPGAASGNRESRKPGAASENKQKRKFGDSGEGRKNSKRGQSGEKKQSDLKKVNGMEICPVSKKCGGCQYQGIPYQEQLKLKEKEIRKWIGKFCKVNAVIGMENPYHYRNKVHAVFDRDKRGNPICGVYQAGTHNVVPIESCMIEDQKADEIIQSIRGLLKSFKIRTYDEDTGYGLLRHVLVKRGFTTNEIMVVLVTASPVFPSKNNFVGAIRKLHPEITTIIQNVNARGTSMVLGDKEKTLFGKGYIEDILCGCTFRISSKSFYQVNPVQTEVLYKKAIDAAGLTGNELVIDAYCGIGTIGLIASKKAKQVIGVELNKDAVRDAVTNAKRNEIENVRFYCADAGNFMADMAAQGEKADVVFMDPPRSGSTEEFMDSMVQMGPERVVYVSCNPETLGRDLEYLTKKGYGCKGSWGVDMFGWTGHVETAVLLERKAL